MSFLNKIHFYAYVVLFRFSFKLSYLSKTLYNFKINLLHIKLKIYYHIIHRTGLFKIQNFGNGYTCKNVFEKNFIIR